MNLHQDDKQSIEKLVKQRDMLKRIVRKQNKVIADMSFLHPPATRKKMLKDAQVIEAQLNKLDELLRD